MHTLERQKDPVPGNSGHRIWSDFRFRPADADEHRTEIVVVFQKPGKARAVGIGALGGTEGVVAGEGSIPILHRHEVGAKFALFTPVVE